MIKNKIKKRIIIKEFYTYIFLFCIVFLIHEIINLKLLSPWAMGDELGTLASAAYFSGMDWKSVMQSPSNLGTGVNFYGGGFGILFTPFFYFVKNRPFLLYQLILSVCSIVHSLTALICYRTLQKYFNIKNRMFCITISIAASFFVMSRATNAMNENMIILCFWCISYLILSLANINKEKMFSCGLILSLISSYSYTVHTRCLPIIFVALITSFFICVYRKNIKCLINIAVVTTFGLFLAQKFNSFIMNTIFIENKNAPVFNTANSATSSILQQIMDLFNNNHWQAFGDIFITNYFGFMVVSILSFGIVTTIWLIHVKRFIFLERKLNNFLLLGFLVLGSVWGMLFLYSIHGLGNTITALSENICTRAHFYLRYAGAYAGPIIALYGVSIWERLISKKIFILNFIMFLLSGIYVIWSILPRIDDRLDQQMDFFHFFAPFNLMKYSEFFRRIDFYFLLLAISVLCILGWCLIKHKKRIFSAVFILILIFYQYSYIALEFDVNNSKDLHQKVWNAIEILSSEEMKENISIVYCPLVSGRWEIPYVLQYYLPKIKIIKEFPETPRETENSVLLLFKALDMDRIEDKYYYTVLPNGMYLYLSIDVYDMTKDSLNLTFYNARKEGL